MCVYYTNAMKKPGKSSRKTLVGYMEDRAIAQRVRGVLTERGTQVSDVLRSAFRAVLNTNGDERQILLKESNMAKRIDVSKSTLRSMRERDELVDSAGPIWQRLTETENSTVYYDVERADRFFLKRGPLSAEN
jgi:hypothetical protein